MLSNPKAARPHLDSAWVPDYVGGFVVTAAPDEAAIAERFDRVNDNSPPSW